MNRRHYLLAVLGSLSGCSRSAEYTEECDKDGDGDLDSDDIEGDVASYEDFADCSK